MTHCPRAGRPSARPSPGTRRPTPARSRTRSPPAHRAGPCRGPTGSRRSRPGRGRARHRPTGRAGSRRHDAARPPGSWPGRRRRPRGRRRRRRRSRHRTGATVATDGGIAWRGGRSAPARRSWSGGRRVTRTEGRRQGDGARDRGSGRGQAGRWPGVGQVEQDARELGTDEDRGRRPGVGERETRAATGEPTEPRRGRRIGQTVIGQDGLDVARADEPEAEAEAARSNRREEARLLVRAEEDGHAGRRLLEGLEQGRLGVLVHPVGTLDDRHACAALDRHQLQLDDEILDASELRLGATDDHLATGPGRARGGAGPDGCRARPAGTPGRHGTAARPGPPCRAGRPRCREPGSSCRPRQARPAGRPGARRPGSSWPPRRARRPAPGSGRDPRRGRSDGFGRRRRLARRAPLRCGVAAVTCRAGRGR